MGKSKRQNHKITRMKKKKIKIKKEVPTVDVVSIKKFDQYLIALQVKGNLL